MCVYLVCVHTCLCLGEGNSRQLVVSTSLVKMIATENDQKYKMQPRIYPVGEIIILVEDGRGSKIKYGDQRTRASREHRRGQRSDFFLLHNTMLFTRLLCVYFIFTPIL